MPHPHHQPFPAVGSAACWGTSVYKNDEVKTVEKLDWCVIETCVDVPGAQAVVLSRHDSEGEALAAVGSASQYVDQKPAEQEILSDHEQWESRKTFYGGV